MKKTKKFIICFLITGIVFLIPTLISNLVLSVYNVSSVRPSAAINPVAGIIFGWPAALGCAVSNFVSDLISGYGLSVALMGFLPQLLYGILPYYAWKLFTKSKADSLRLGTVVKVVVFALIMLVNSFIMGTLVGLIQFAAAKAQLVETAVFAFLNDFDMSIIFGLPVMALVDYRYSKYRHGGKQKLSINEKIILYSAALQLVCFTLIMLADFVAIGFGDPKVLWPQIFKTTGITVNVVLLLSLAAMIAAHYIRKKHLGLEIVESGNKTIFADKKKNIEFVSLPEGQPENNHPVYEDGWRISLACQKGCMMKCSFCDCAERGFFGNVTRDEFSYQLETALKNSGSNKTKALTVDFSRMGEPVFNDELLEFIANDLIKTVEKNVQTESVSICLSTMMPKSSASIRRFLDEYCRIGRDVFGGKAQLEFSINSTDEAQRNDIFGGKALALGDIAEIVKGLPMPEGGKYTLTFVVTDDTVIDADVIDRLFDKSKCKILLSPLSDTFVAGDNEIVSKNSKEIFAKAEKNFSALGWEVCVKKPENGEFMAPGQSIIPRLKEKLAKKEPKKIGLLVAIEMDAIFAHYSSCKELDAPRGFRLFLVKKENCELYILQTGMGEVKSSAGVQYLISKCGVSTIVNFGVVGGLKESMSLCKVCIVDRVVHYKYDCSEFMPLSVGQLDDHITIDLLPSEALVKAALKINGDLLPVTCCSGDKFVGTKEEKTFLSETFGGDICDMESAGIVIACEMNDVPCILFKAVSDGLSNAASDFYSELEKASKECLEVADKIIDNLRK